MVYKIAHLTLINLHNLKFFEQYALYGHLELHSGINSFQKEKNVFLRAMKLS